MSARAEIPRTARLPRCLPAVVAVGPARTWPLGECAMADGRWRSSLRKALRGLLGLAMIVGRDRPRCGAALSDPAGVLRPIGVEPASSLEPARRDTGVVRQVRDHAGAAESPTGAGNVTKTTAAARSDLAERQPSAGAARAMLCTVTELRLGSVRLEALEPVRLLGPARGRARAVTLFTDAAAPRMMGVLDDAGALLVGVRPRDEDDAPRRGARHRNLVLDQHQRDGTGTPPDAPTMQRVVRRIGRGPRSARAHVGGRFSTAGTRPGSECTPRTSPTPARPCGRSFSRRRAGRPASCGNGAPCAE